MSIDPYFDRADGQTSLIFCLAIVNTSAPTAAELNAGVSLAEATADIGGFTFENQPISMPNLAKAFEGSVDGPDTAEDCSLTLYDDKTSSATRTALAKGTDGYVVWNSYARTTGSETEVWPVRSTGVNHVRTLDAAAAQVMVKFAVPDRPVKDAVWPAGVTI